MKYKRTIQQVRVLAVLLCLVAFLVLNSIVHSTVANGEYSETMPEVPENGKLYIRITVNNLVENSKQDMNVLVT